MAILQTTLAEETLSRSEKAIVRGIYRASQLNEALIALQKCDLSLSAENANSKIANACQPKDYVEQLKAFLLNSIAKALISTKVPQPTSTEIKPSQPE